MRRLMRGDCLRFDEAVRRAFPLMAQMDVPRCLAEMKTLGPDKQREWAHRSRAPLRMIVPLYNRDQAPAEIREAYGHEGEVHTVLCLTADLLERLPAAAERLWVPPGEPDIRAWSPLVGMQFLQSALSWAEAAQDREVGWRLYPR